MMIAGDGVRRGARGGGARCKKAAGGCVGKGSDEGEVAVGEGSGGWGLRQTAGGGDGMGGGVRAGERAWGEGVG